MVEFTNALNAFQIAVQLSAAHFVEYQDDKLRDALAAQNSARARVIDLFNLALDSPVPEPKP